MNIDFHHRQSAHCESGVTANLLNHYGVDCSEALAFGIGSGLFFAYAPFIRLNFLPLTTFRTAPGSIFRKASKRLGIQVRQQCFKHPIDGEQTLDRLLAVGCPVGAQTGVFWLPYFPPAYRFHFNGHNLVVTGKQEDEYLISDPIFEQPVRCAAADLRQARFAKGALAPKGRIYYIESLPDNIDLPSAIISGIKDVCRVMLATPVPVAGVRGISFLARRIIKWPARLGEKRTLQHLGHIVRMQEEIGTGGGGFRFIYAAFLQEAAALIGNEALLPLSRRCTAIGDDWRELALLAARICKGRAELVPTVADLAQRLEQLAAAEKSLYQDLRTAVAGFSAKGRE